MKRIINLPLTDEVIQTLHSGDKVYLTGKIYTARDAAHLKLIQLIKNGEALPLEIQGQVIYYAGPSPARPGQVIGACGPTTSYRMDDLTLPLLELGLKGMIGKGDRSPQIKEGIVKHQAVYFAAIGGAGALIASSIQRCEILAFEELGPEALRCLEVVEMPVYVVMDSNGNNLYETEPARFSR